MISRVDPDFSTYPTKRKQYWFLRNIYQPYNEFIVLSSSHNYCCFACDLVWTYWPTWNLSYGGDHMQYATGLPNVRVGSGMVEMEESVYHHDGTESGIRKTLDLVEYELKAYALPWFLKNQQDARDDRLLQFGLMWTRIHDRRISPSIVEELGQAWIDASKMRWRFTHPLFDELKNELMDFAYKIGSTADERKSIFGLGLDLLRYAAQKKARQEP